MEMLIGLFIGSATYMVFEMIDYHYFDSFMKKRFLPNQNSIIVLDDEETYSINAYSIKLSDEEMDRVNSGEKVSRVVEDFSRWRAI